MGPGGNGARQADETSNISVTHRGQASEAFVKVKSVDSGDIGVNIANSEGVACRAFNFNSASNLSVPIAINGVSMTAILDTWAQVTVVSDTFVRRHLAGLKFSGAYNLRVLNLMLLLLLHKVRKWSLQLVTAVIVGNFWKLLLLIIALWDWTLLLILSWISSYLKTL